MTAPKEVDHWEELDLALANKNPYECPKCGSPLIQKEGQYGKFMACPNYPDCRYTRALWTYGVAGVKRQDCQKCKGTGLLPFIKPDGTTSEFAKVFCECREDDCHHEYYPRPRVSDWDFAMSRDWRSYIEQEVTGSPLPALEPPRIEPQVVSDISQPWQKDQWQSVQQTKAMVLHLNNQIKELLAKKKTDNNYEPF